MQILNAKTAPEFQPELVKAALAFLRRVQLNGQETETFVAVTNLLGAISDGTIAVAPARILNPQVPPNAPRSPKAERA